MHTISVNFVVVLHERHNSFSHNIPELTLLQTILHFFSVYWNFLLNCRKIKYYAKSIISVILWFFFYEKLIQLFRRGMLHELLRCRFPFSYMSLLLHIFYIIIIKLLGVTETLLLLNAAAICIFNRIDRRNWNFILELR